MTSLTRAVLEEIADERLRQEELCRSSKPLKFSCADRILGYGDKLAILGEGFGGVCRAVADNESQEQLLRELVQVAAVATAWAEAMMRDLEDSPWTGEGA